jgi:hypothetical protein
MTVVALLAAPAFARPKATPTPVPTPAPVADPAITKIARHQFVSWQAGAVDLSAYEPDVATIVKGKIDDVAKKMGPLGPLTGENYIGPFLASDIPAGAHGYIYQMVCAEGSVYLWMVIDADGKIQKIFFRDKMITENVTATASPSPAPQ